MADNLLLTTPEDQAKMSLILRAGQDVTLVPVPTAVLELLVQELYAVDFAAYHGNRLTAPQQNRLKELVHHIHNALDRAYPGWIANHAFKAQG